MPLFSSILIVVAKKVIFLTWGGTLRYLNGNMLFLHLSSICFVNPSLLDLYGSTDPTIIFFFFLIKKIWIEMKK
jgi:hypothetical protein